ncbi:hypothetical protein [Sporolactobacillus sp. KGMB 08714]|uniref:hypothetical protein n=1 Tax=Sporolactobacillus sp. KGMB 08714 TaxID=3064704 RepID=UPI002FBF1B01
MMKRTWTAEDIHFLRDAWGTLSLHSIANRLNRSVSAVRNRANREGLRDPRFIADVLTINQLSRALCVSYSVVMKWINRFSLPIETRVFVAHEVKTVDMSKFWKWAEFHKSLIDFSKVEPYLLGPEPTWVKTRRQADSIRDWRIKRSLTDAWTREEDRKLQNLLILQRFTYPEIAFRLRRSEEAIKRRIYFLGIKARPVRANNRFYSAEELSTMTSMAENGQCLEEIASRIGKSARGVRDKMERMGYKFKRGVPLFEEALS